MNAKNALYDLIGDLEPVEIKPYIVDSLRMTNYIPVGVLGQACIKITETGENAFKKVKPFDTNNLERIVNNSSKFRIIKLNPYFTSVGFSKSNTDKETKVRLTLFYNNTMNLLKVINLDALFVYTRLSFSNNIIYPAILDKSSVALKPVTKDIIRKMYETVKMIMTPDKEVQ